MTFHKEEWPSDGGYLNNDLAVTLDRSYLDA